VAKWGCWHLLVNKGKIMLPSTIEIVVHQEYSELIINGKKTAHEFNYNDVQVTFMDEQDTTSKTSTLGQLVEAST
jgi:hypothetical protein